MLKGAHSLPITTLVDVTIKRKNTYFVDCRALYENDVVMGIDFLKKARQLLSNTEEAYQPFETNTYSYREEYKVRMLVGKSYRVNLRQIVNGPCLDDHVNTS